MGAKFHTSFLVQDAGTSLCREVNAVVEVNRLPGNMLEQEDIEQILSDSLEIETADLRLIHWSRLH